MSGSDKIQILKVTALEVISEPLTFLMLLSALAMSALAPAFHYHQFGEATRMARDAGVSALMVGGTIVALYGAMRTIRRDLESGTAAMTLSHGVSRGQYFLWKTLGVMAAYLLWTFALSLQSLVMVQGAAVGGVIAKETGDVAKVFGPSLALALVPVVLPIILAGFLHRFAHCRFVLTANVTTLILSLLSFTISNISISQFYNYTILQCYNLSTIWLPTLVWIAAACAFARLRLNFAITLTILFIVLIFPLNFYALLLLPVVLGLGAFAFTKMELS